MNGGGRGGGRAGDGLWDREPHIPRHSPERGRAGQEVAADTRSQPNYNRSPYILGCGAAGHSRSAPAVPPQPSERFVLDNKKTYSPSVAFAVRFLPTTFSCAPQLGCRSVETIVERSRPDTLSLRARVELSPSIFPSKWSYSAACEGLKLHTLVLYIRMRRRFLCAFFFGKTDRPSNSRPGHAEMCGSAARRLLCTVERAEGCPYKLLNVWDRIGQPLGQGRRRLT